MSLEKITWPPENIPVGFALTPYKDGYCKTVNNKWRHICGKLAPKAALARFNERLRNGDFDRRSQRIASGPTLTVKQLANLYGNWLQERLDGKHRKKFSLRAFDDYRLALQKFLDVRIDDLRMADLRVAELRQQDFAAYMAAIPGKSPYTRSRYVATVKAMFAWAVTDGHLDRPPAFGSNFGIASKDDLREARANLKKSFEPKELWQLLAAIKPGSAWEAMIWLSLNGAFSNIELARLRRDQVNLETGIVQTIRGKKGRAMRKTLLWPMTIDALKRYVRPAAAMPQLEDLFFLTRYGLPWVCQKVGRNEAGKVVKAPRQDSLSTGFGKILQDVTLPREGRSFSGLRTTFRTEADAAVIPDNDAIDLIVGHPRRHISSEYVEKFPVHRLQAVTEVVFSQLFDGWCTPMAKQTARPQSSSSRVYEPQSLHSPECVEIAATERPRSAGSDTSPATSQANADLLR